MADEHDIGGAPPPAKAKPGPSVSAPQPEAAASGRGDDPVAALRLRIDQIDDQLMKLLNSRSACAVEIGRIKRRLGLPVYQPEREKWILDRVERNNPGPLDSNALQRVFERVIDESRRLERLAGEKESSEKE